MAMLSQVLGLRGVPGGGQNSPVDCFVSPEAEPTRRGRARVGAGSGGVPRRGGSEI